MSKLIFRVGVNQRSLAIIPCLFFYTHSILAQGNTSYNANSIPITGSYNTALGSLAFFSNSTGVDNVAVGYKSLYYNTSGSSNAAYGTFVLNSNTTGNYNIGLGWVALLYNSTGTANIA